MKHISKHQLISLIILFEIGSTTLFPLGIKAKKDAWIAIFIAMLIGLVLIWFYTELQKNYPEKNLAEIIIVLLGEYVGSVLVFSYAAYFIFVATRIIRSFGELMIFTFLKKTPLEYIIGIFLLALLFLIFQDLEVIARSSEIMMPIVVLSIISVFVLIGISGEVDLKGITPVLENGFMPVFKATFPLVVTFPFGEMVVFLMYWCFVCEKKSSRKVSMLSIIFSGSILMMTLIILISVLGVSSAESANVPLVQVIKLINIVGIIANMDAIGIIFIFVGGMYKAILFLYAGITALSFLFKIEQHKWFITIVVSIFSFWISVYQEQNYAIRQYVALKITPQYIHIPFQIILPIMLLMITWLKKKCDQRN